MNCSFIELLCAPERSVDLPLSQWDEVIPQARNAGLIATLGCALEERGLLERIPPNVRRHLISGMLTYRKQQDNLIYELKWLRRALAEIGERLILLKGAAYCVAHLTASKGRLMSDIDLLVPAARIGDVEDALKRYGWETGELDPYNERYYRLWMHEIPPLGHVDRGSTLDVHHTIIPPTAGIRLDAERLFANLVQVAPDLFVLGRHDMVIHSAAHLFHEGEFGHGLRDLWDLHQLLREFTAVDPSFWSVLVSRARELDLVDSLYYALRYIQMCFGTPLAKDVLENCRALRRSPAPPRMMDFLFRRVFVPDHPSCWQAGTQIAHACLYIRSHYLRMPLYLLVPHLVRKAWMGFTPKREPPDIPTDAGNQA